MEDNQPSTSNAAAKRRRAVEPPTQAQTAPAQQAANQQRPKPAPVAAAATVTAPTDTTAAPTATAATTTTTTAGEAAQSKPKRTGSPVFRADMCIGQPHYLVHNAPLSESDLRSPYGGIHPFTMPTGPYFETPIGPFIRASTRRPQPPQAPPENVSPPMYGSPMVAPPPGFEQYLTNVMRPPPGLFVVPANMRPLHYPVGQPIQLTYTPANWSTGQSAYGQQYAAAGRAATASEPAGALPYDQNNMPRTFGYTATAMAVNMPAEMQPHVALEPPEVAVEPAQEEAPFAAAAPEEATQPLLTISAATCDPIDDKSSNFCIHKPGTVTAAVTPTIEPNANADKVAELAEDLSLSTLSLTTDLDVPPCTACESNEKMECTVIVNDTSFVCDVELLQKNCTYFGNATKGSRYLLPSNSVCPDAFSIIYMWIERSLLVVSPNKIMTVYIAVDFLGVSSLMDQYKDLFSNYAVAREEIGFYIYTGLRKWNLPNPNRISLFRVQKFFLTLVGMVEFTELSGSEVTLLLDSHSICVNSEVEVLLAAIVWLLYDWANRREWYVRVMSCVKFSSIPEHAITPMMKNASSTDLELIFYHPSFCSLAARSRHAQCCPEKGKMQHRFWVYDELCAYHHDAMCPKRHLIEYAQFDAYLLTLRAAPPLHWYDRGPINTEPQQCRNVNCIVKELLADEKPPESPPEDTERPDAQP